MPEFEDNKLNPNLPKEGQQYQPNRASQDSSPKSSTTSSSNMRGRWKRSSRGTPKTTAKNDTQEERSRPEKVSFEVEKDEEVLSHEEDYKVEDYENEYENYDEQEYEQEFAPPRSTREEREPRHMKEEYNPRSQTHKKPREEKPFKPTPKKEVFIPKTKQDSERYRRNPSIASKKPSLWKKILAFFGLGKPTKKSSSEHKSYSKSSDSSRGPRPSSHGKRPYQQNRHSGQNRRPRSGPGHKQYDQKSND